LIDVGLIDTSVFVAHNLLKLGLSGND